MVPDTQEVPPCTMQTLYQLYCDPILPLTQEIARAGNQLDEMTREIAQQV